MKRLTASLMVCFVAACAAPGGPPSPENDPRLLTREHFRATASIKDGPLDLIAIVSTVSGFQAKQGLLGVVNDDHFLRAFVEKRSAKVTYQVYVVARYRGESWRFFNTATYETSVGPAAALVMTIGRDVDCASSRYLGCSYVEQIAFDVPEQVLREVAQRAAADSLWQVKVNSKSGVDSTRVFVVPEVQGLLDRVDEYRASLTRPASNPS